MRRPLAVQSGPPRSGALLWTACCAGREPAESLDPRDREDLVADLIDRGWTVVEIATHTRMSTYTTGRIADRVTGRALLCTAVEDITGQPCRRLQCDGTHSWDGTRPPLAGEECISRTHPGRTVPPHQHRAVAAGETTPPGRTDLEEMPA